MIEKLLNFFRKRQPAADVLEPIFDYFRCYDRASYAVYACQGNEPTEAMIREFERDLGFRLPENFRDFSKSPLGGLYMEIHECFWPQPRLDDMEPFWAFRYGIKVFGFATDAPEWLDIRRQQKRFADAGAVDVVPFLQVCGGAALYCFNREGRIFRWHHEKLDKREYEAFTFPQILMREIVALDASRESALLNANRSNP